LKTGAVRFSFHLRTGNRRAKRFTESVIRFKRKPRIRFGWRRPHESSPNVRICDGYAQFGKFGAAVLRG